MDVIMKRVFERERLPAGAVVRDVLLRRCSFINCWVDPSEFSLIERVILEQTTLRSKQVSKLILRDVTIDTCKRNSTFIMNRCLFDRVTMRGEFGSWFFATFAEYTSEQAKVAACFYDTVDWALDISEARFRNLTLRGVPGDKIRRDPKRHGLLRKDRLLADRCWEAYEDKGLVAVLRASLDRPEETEVLAADDSKKFEANVKRLEMLRNAGFSE